MSAHVTKCKNFPVFLRRITTYDFTTLSHLRDSCALHTVNIDYSKLENNNIGIG